MSQRAGRRTGPFRRLTAVAGALVLLVTAAVVGLPGAAQANGRTFLITAHHSAKCLDVAHAWTHHGANVLQANCTGTWNQHWRRQDTTDGFFLLIARHSGKCLDVAHASTLHGADVVQADCWAGFNQQWRFGAVSTTGHVELVARHSGRCLDVAHASTAHGADVIQGTCSALRNQRWMLHQVTV